MSLLKDLKSIERYETESLPELVSRIERKNKKDIKYINDKYESEYEYFKDIPIDILEAEGDDVMSIVEMSYLMRNYPDEYERYSSAGKFYNKNDPYMPLDMVEEGGVPKEVLKVMSEPDDYNLGM
tara:strand:+ start:578 stop:952 length:375 start_codon:yes stop_codon:yes gene_type:complete